VLVLEDEAGKDVKVSDFS